MRERAGKFLTIASAAGAALAACCAVWGQGEAPLSDKDYQRAIDAIRQVALDKAESPEHRTDAVAAGVKVLLWKKRHDEALAFCKEVLKDADRTLAEAALRAGCLAHRDRAGHLKAEMDFLASHSRGPQSQAASTVSRELDRTVQALSSLSARSMVPAPVVLHFPTWATAAPRAAPHALYVTLPKIEPPSWYRGLSFPPLKEPRK